MLLNCHHAATTLLYVEEFIFKSEFWLHLRRLNFCVCGQQNICNFPDLFQLIAVLSQTDSKKYAEKTTFWIYM